ncbi:MAG TPA: EF-hand domain-containing protein, partial [Buttiauxella sp.]
MKMVLPVDGYRSATDFMAAMQGSEGDAHWLMKKGEHWHGGIHICDGFAGNAVFKPDSHGLKCMTDGQVVAWRLNDDYQTAAYGKKTLKFSSTFVLIKSTCTPDKDKPDNALDFYTLWMQIAPLSEYGITDTPTATVIASALKIRQDNTSPGWIRSGLREGVNVPRDALRHYEVPQDTQTTLPRGAVVEIKQEASFLLNGRPAPFVFVSVVSVPEGTKSGLTAGESGWISGLNKFVKRQDVALPAWMQAARQHGVFNQVVTVSGEDAPAVKAGDIIGHLSLNERPSGGPQHFCHLEVFSQDARMKDFLANKAGVTTGASELHTLADKTRWVHREQDNSFVVAGVGGDPSPTTAERYTPESECRRLEADGKTWYYIPGELAWMAAADVESANQFDLEKRGFMPLEQEDAPQSIFQTPKESWLRQVYRQLEALARSETRDMYSSSYTEQYQKLLKQMDLNQDGVIDAGELWRFLHNTQPHIQYQVQRFVVKHHSEWLKDGMSALWQAALDEQAKKYPDMALYNRYFINKLVWMKDVPEIRSSEALWHMHP